MKLTVIACFVVWAAVFCAAEEQVAIYKKETIELLKRILQKNFDGKTVKQEAARSLKISSETEKMSKFLKDMQAQRERRKLAEKHLDLDCDIADVNVNFYDKDTQHEGGMITYLPVNKRSTERSTKDHKCSFRVTADKGNTIAFYITATTSGGKGCDANNQLSFHELVNGAPVNHVITCDSGPNYVWTGSEAVIRFSENKKNINSFVILYSIQDLSGDDAGVGAAASENGDDEFQQSSRDNEERGGEEDEQ